MRTRVRTHSARLVQAMQWRGREQAPPALRRRGRLLDGTWWYSLRFKNTNAPHAPYAALTLRTNENIFPVLKILSSMRGGEWRGPRWGGGGPLPNPPLLRQHSVRFRQNLP